MAKTKKKKSGKLKTRMKKAYKQTVDAAIKYNPQIQTLKMAKKEWDQLSPEDKEILKKAAIKIGVKLALLI